MCMGKIDYQPYLLVECSDYDCIYKVLLFDENVNKKEIQNSIYVIKEHFYEEDFDGWTIEDVFEELRKQYSFIELDAPGYLEV